MIVTKSKPPSSLAELKAIYEANVTSGFIWEELDNALFMELEDETELLILFNCHYYDDHGTTVYSNLEVNAVIHVDDDGQETELDINLKGAKAILEDYLISKDYYNEDAWNESLADEADWLATCRDTDAWLKG